MPRRPDLTITFHKVLSPRLHAWWEAERRTGGRVRGGYMPIGHGVIPHDLAHLATEAHFGIDDGFWGLLARGATFKRGTGQRPTRRGRALIADNRSGLHAAEQLGNAPSRLVVPGEADTGRSHLRPPGRAMVLGAGPRHPGRVLADVDIRPTPSPDRGRAEVVSGRARWAFLRGLRNRDPARNRYRSSMYRVGLAIIGIGLAAALLVGIVVPILQ